MKKLVLILICLILCACTSTKKIVDYDAVNNFDYDNYAELDFEIHSKEYLVADMSELRIMYQKDADKKIYPASLTKVMTLDTVLSLVNNLDETSSVSYEQVQALIVDDASLAYIQTDYDYSLRDLLYALILPSGADAAVGLENYFVMKNMDLVEEMNKRLKVLGCNDTHFVNTTGLHDNDHYTTLNDLLKIVMDVLKYEDGRRILETLTYDMSDGIHLTSSLYYINNYEEGILGGKTGYTTESGRSVLTLYRKNNRSYLLIVANAMSQNDEEDDRMWHLMDAMEIMQRLY